MRCGTPQLTTPGPVGFDTANSTYTAVGSPAARVAYTARADVGRALAQLCILCMSGAAAPAVPAHVRIGGALASMEDVAAAMAKARGAAIAVGSVERAQFRADLQAAVVGGEAASPAQHIRCVCAWVWMSGC